MAADQEHGAASEDPTAARGAGTTGLPQVVDGLAVVPLVGQAVQYLLNFIPAVADERARQLLGTALQLMERNDEWLCGEFEKRPRAAQFVARACRSWATDDEEAHRQKRTAYRKILMRGLIDDAVVDHESLRLIAIGELTTLDLSILQIVEDEIGMTSHPVVTGVTIVERMRKDVGTVQVVLAHLERLAILQPAGRTYGELSGDDESGVPSTLRFTVFGREVMNDLSLGE